MLSTSATQNFIPKRGKHIKALNHGNDKRHFVGFTTSQDLSFQPSERIHLHAEFQCDRSEMATTDNR